MWEASLPGHQERCTRLRWAGGSAIALLLVVASVACGSSTSPTSVATIAVSGAAPAVGATSPFTATATLADGTAQDVTTLATWSSSNSATATVSTGGLVAGVGAGAVTIQATYQNVTGSDTIAVAQQ